MRRQDRYIFNGAVLGAGLTALGDAIIQWVEHINMGEKFTWQTYDGKRTLKYSFLGGCVGGVSGYVAYQCKLNEEEKLPFSSDLFIKKVLAQEHLKSNHDVYNIMLACRENVKRYLAEILRTKLVVPPEDSGSFYKRTAINSNYDLDVILAFNKNSYKSLERMYYDVYDILVNAYGSIASVKSQTKSIQIAFNYKGILISFDIVPGREINNYVIDKKLNLFVKPISLWHKKSSFKTNIEIQKRITTNNPEARKIIKLIKAYRDRNGLVLPTVILEQCIVEALSEDNFGIHSSATVNLLNSMKFLLKKIKQKYLIDYANSNNNLLDKLNSVDRYNILSQMESDISKIEENSRYIMEIFYL